LKQYLYQFRLVVISYERFLDVGFEHMLEVYRPARLRLILITQPRGGTCSKLTIDSDWAIRGGKEDLVTG
jgi:7-cyano-7-deazaguanine reductase